MKRIRLSPAAISDLDEIWFFIAEDSPHAADRFQETLSSTFATLATQPLMGRARDEIRSGIRGFPIGNYVILYQDRPEWLEIVRVLHGARDFEGIF